MAASLNRVCLLGRLGRDVELKYTQGGTAVTTIPICTDEREKQSDGSYITRPEWHQCVLWAKTAENASRYLHKGSLVYIEGALRTRKYSNKDGIEVKATEIIVNSIQFLDSKQGGPEQQPQQIPQQQYMQPQQQQYQQQPVQQGYQQTPMYGQVQTDSAPF